MYIMQLLNVFNKVTKKKHAQYNVWHLVSSQRSLYELSYLTTSAGVDVPFGGGSVWW